MKIRRLAIFLAAVVLCTAVLPGMGVNAAKDKAVGGRTYYVSTVDGNDNNDGTSESKAFYSLDKINDLALSPGDKVLLERGSIFKNGFLHINGSGSEGAPIVVDAYGDATAPLPHIETNGQGIWYQNYRTQLDSASHKYQGYVSSSVLLYDVEYIEIKNLEISNKAPKIETTYNELDVMNRTGVAAVAQNKGTIDHIYLDNLYIHDVIGNVYDKHMNNGGIYFTVFQPKDESATGIARYDEVKIENCYVDNVNRWGIAVGYSYTHGRFGGRAIADETIEKYGSGNVVIRNNYVKDPGGDAITVMYCDRPLVEYNVSDGAARQINSKDYSKTGSGRVAAAIWPWKCKNAVFQYNEAFDTCQNQDGQAWDADSGDGTIYQYNYSHNNGGGCVMFCAGEAYQNTFRYNISQNDLGGVMNPAGQPDAHVYNNTFFVKDGIDFIRTNMGGGPMVVENNIIYYGGSSPKTEEWFKHTNATATKYDNNLYYNYTNTPSNDVNAITEDPKFADAGQAPADPASGIQGGRINGSVVHDRTAFDGYKLAADSPAVNAGKAIQNNGGQDFFGNKVTGTPDIGAFESDVVSLEVLSDIYEVDPALRTIKGLEANTTVSEFLANLNYDEKASIKVMDGQTEVTSSEKMRSGMKVVLSHGGEERVYTIVASSDNDVKETIYMLEGQTIYVPILEKNPTTVEEVKKGIKVHSTAQIKVIAADGNEVRNGNLKDGMEVVIQAENGDENKFTVSEKNIYQWALDYAGPQQGNVWFGQIKNSETKYQNLADYDSTYPNWVVDTYYGMGVDLPNHNTPTDENTHGLLADTTGASKKEGMAMSFRAPKSGKIQVAVKEDEPYLRQNGNSNGTVTLSFTKNGEVLGDTYTLETSRVKVDVGVRELEVRKGEWIRVEAKNNGSPTRPSIHVTPTITYLNEVYIDKTELEQAVKDAESYEQQLDKYTEETAEAFREALEAARAVLEKKDATQEEVNQAKANLAKAIAALVEKTPDPEKPDKPDPENPDKPDPENPDKPNPEKPDTPEPEKPDTPDPEKPDMPDPEKPDTPDPEKPDTPDPEKPDTSDPEKPDTAELEQAVTGAESYEQQLDKYTEETAKAFREALAAARAVLEKKDATQEEINLAKANLAKAMAALAEKTPEPEKPNTPLPNPDPKQKNKVNVAKTGDNANIYAWIITMLISAGGVIVLRKKKN